MNRMTWAEQLYGFYLSLADPSRLPGLPRGVEWLHPQSDPAVMQVVKQFCEQYFSDHNTRILMLGINPGRYGAGVTGVNFTAPKQLRQFCHINHPFKEQSELSAEFIYDMIHAFGGVDTFYRHCFIGSVCPLGLVKAGKNINYYDEPLLMKRLTPFITETIEQQLSYGVNRQAVVCIGGEKNYRFLSQLNEKRNWFKDIIPVAHPRFIMQYRRKYKEQFIQEYLQAIHKAMEYRED